MTRKFVVAESFVRQRLNCGPVAAPINPQIESISNYIVWTGFPLSSWKMPRLGGVPDKRRRSCAGTLIPDIYSLPTKKPRIHRQRPGPHKRKGSPDGCQKDARI